MRSLIFGAAGFIGSNLIRHLSSKSGQVLMGFDNFSMGNMALDLGDIVPIIQGDMCNFDEVCAVLTDFKPDRVYHLVANSDIALSAIHPGIDIRNTFNSTAVLMRALSRLPARELVFSSSSAIYGSTPGLISEQSVPKPESAYGWMKLASEQLIELAVQAGDIERALTVRFPNVTGPYQTHGVVFDLVNKLNQNPHRLQVLGDGSQLKPYGHVVDLVEIIDRLIEASWDGYVDFNISPPDRTSVEEIASMVKSIANSSASVEFGQTRSGWAGDVPEYEFSTLKAQEAIGKLGVSVIK